MADLKKIFEGAPADAKKLGVVGHPLDHSLSPVMQEAAIKALGLRAVYRKIEVAPEAWKDFIAQAAAMPLDGFNITVPYKERILKEAVPLGVELNPAFDVEQTGAVNTVDREVMEDVSVWSLYNTDGPGFLADLTDLGVDPSGRNVVLVGAGGAARAILSLFEDLDPARVTLWNRTPSRAHRLAEEFRDRLGLGPDRIAVAGGEEEAREAVAHAALVVNATSAGLSPGDPPPLDPAWLHDHLTLYDLIYHRETELMAAAKQAGADVYGGLGMLVQQGAKAFEIWFNQKPPLDAMRRAAEEELKKRQGA